MTKIVQGEAAFVVSADLGRKLLAEERRFTIESLADAIHLAYCESTPFRGVQGEVHRRTHLEIARMIFDKSGSVNP